MQISQNLKPILDEFEKSLFSKIPQTARPHFEAAKYILESGGKRLRPLLVFSSVFDLNPSLIEKAYDPAVAIEFIHTYSLVHDDLPCMDDDDIRRGKPSLHKAFDEATAVLVGDFLLTEAFAVLLQSFSLTDAQKVSLAQRLSFYSGGRQLIEGQIIDMQMEGKVGHFYDLVNLYLRKTSSLFCCSLEFGSILADRNDLAPLLKEVGQKLGLAFQIKNDFQGKQKDIEKEKFTIFAVHNEKQAKLMIEKSASEALELLEKSDLAFGELKELIKKMFLI